MHKFRWLGICTIESLWVSSVIKINEMNRRHESNVTYTMQVLYVYNIIVSYILYMYSIDTSTYRYGHASKQFCAGY